MKLFLIIFLSSICSGLSQVKVALSYQSDLKIHVVDYEYQADLLVYKLKNKYEAKSHWVFTVRF